MERICDRANLNQAYKRVKSNKGAAGVDGITVEQLLSYLRDHKEELIQSLLDGSYEPQMVRGVKIPKPGGGKRQLGIPTAVDRVIQQAILQVLEPLYDPGFSESSYGFRPKRSAHQALKRAKEYVSEGYEFVVDIDLEKFFDRVNHDILMSRLARRIRDKRLLKIIRRFLTAGMMEDGICNRRDEGTPQGGPLSPLLSNILLDELDKELEERRHRFCRYADDCNIYVKTRKAGERVLSSLRHFLWKRLKLRLNEEKSASAPVNERKFLGYTIGINGQLKVAEASIDRMKKKIRELTNRSRGISLECVIAGLNIYLQGWVNYFRLNTHKSTFKDLDSWIRRRLRCYRLKQRKTAWPIATYLISLGVPRKGAWSLAKSSKGWWRLSHNSVINAAMPNVWFKKMGLVSLTDRLQLLNS
jgi:RNA-directed DNA polymerase